MRFLMDGRRLLPNSRWSELTGPMTLMQAEQYVDDPPRDLGDPGVVTIDRSPQGGFVVLALEAKHR